MPRISSNYNTDDQRGGGGDQIADSNADDCVITFVSFQSLVKLKSSPPSPPAAELVDSAAIIGNRAVEG